MTLLLPILATLFGVLAAFTPMIPTFIPSIGLLPMYRLRLFRSLFLISAWALAIAATIGTPSSFWALPVVLLLSIPTIVLEPQRIFVPLNDPEHLPPSKTDFQGEALVLGYSDDENALAWPFETLAPRHLINDLSGDEPLLVAY